MQSFALLFLRVGVGGLLLYGRGFVKVTHFAELFDRFQDPLGLGSEVSLVLVILVEVVCALLVVLGLFTRLAAVPIVATIVLALLFVHGGDPWARIEVALLYLIPFASIIIAGPGWYSLDHARKRRRKKRRAGDPASYHPPAVQPAPYQPAPVSPSADASAATRVSGDQSDDL